MNKLLLKMLLLALPFAGFLGWFEVARGGRENNSYLLKRNRLLAAADRVEVLVLGSSHEEEAVLPALLSTNAFSLASVSQSLFYDCALTERHLQSLPRLRLVLLPLSYFAIASELDSSPEVWRAHYYARFHGVLPRDHHLWLCARNCSAWFLYGTAKPLDSLRGRYPPPVGMYFDQQGGRTKLGEEQRFDRGPGHMENSANEALRRHEAMMDLRLVPEQKSRMQRCIRVLQQRGIKVVLFQSPLTARYREHRRPEWTDAYYQFVAELQRDLGVAYHDYSADPRFVEEDFWDGDHLDYGGAEKFSRLLRDEVVSPALEASSSAERH